MIKMIEYTNFKLKRKPEKIGFFKRKTGKNVFCSEIGKQIALVLQRNF